MGGSDTLQRQWGGCTPSLTFKQRQRLEADGLLGKRFSLTLVQPITEPVEDDVLFARRHQADGAAAHRGAIVNVVLEDEDLKKTIERKQKTDN